MALQAVGSSVCCQSPNNAKRQLEAQMSSSTLPLLLLCLAFRHRSPDDMAHRFGENHLWHHDVTHSRDRRSAQSRRIAFAAEEEEEEEGGSRTAVRSLKRPTDRLSEVVRRTERRRERANLHARRGYGIGCTNE